jgi:hypothetical protein
MNLSIEEGKINAEAEQRYENEYIKHYKKMLFKKKLEELFIQKIMIYADEVNERRETEKLFVEDNKFILSKKLWSHF